MNKAKKREKEKLYRQDPNIVFSVLNSNREYDQPLRFLGVLASKQLPSFLI